MSGLVPKHLGAFILLLLVTALPPSTAQNTYYVKPTPDTPCHEDPCHTLSEYVSESEEYFTSNTTMVFLPGEHVLQQNTTVTNVGRLALLGSSSSSPANVSRIICTDAKLDFTNIGILEITDLDFHSCTIELEASSVVFSKSSFENSSSSFGGAIYVHSSIITFDGETRFEGNRAAVSGGGIFAEESNLTFHGNTTFINNLAMEQGGGIHIVNQCYLNISGNASFVNNIAEYGGGVYVGYSTVRFDDDSRFINNSAEWSGGGVYVWNSTVSFGDTSRFIDNSAEFYSGGGVYVVDCTVSFGNNCRFINNSAEYGGGVDIWYSNVSFGDNIRFTTNSAQWSGGGWYVWYSTVSFGDDSRFIDNSAEWSGGGVYAEESIVSFGDNCRFIDNTAKYYGGGLDMWHGNVSFGDNSVFINSSAQWRGGGVYVVNSTVSFDHNSDFIGNLAEYGGGVYVTEDSTLYFGDNSEFIKNSAEYNGGGVFVSGSTMRCGHDSRFFGNTAELDGGALYIWYSNVTFGKYSRFHNNSALSGGGMYIMESIVCFDDDSRFLDNSAGYNGGGVYVEGSTVSFHDSDFKGNSADYFGGCMAGKASTIVDVGGSSHFISNSARYGGCIFVDTCNLIFSQATVLSGNSAITSNWYNIGSGNVYDAWYGGAILASNSNVTFHGSQLLTNNSAGYGGAIYFTLDSKIYLLPNTTMSFERNFALYRGGALFVEDNPFTYCIIDSDVRTSVFQAYACFIQTPLANIWNNYWYNHSIELKFHDNAANEAGSVLYGGNLASCGVCTSDYECVPGNVAFNAWTDISSNLMSSDPYRVCICVDNHPDCNQSNTIREIFPGMTFAVPVVAFGQYDGTVPAVINTYLYEGITLGALQSTQRSHNTCTNLQYTVRSTRDILIWNKATLTLFADEPCSSLGLPLEVSLTFLPCPVGFSLSTEGSCGCDQRLNKYEVDCDINDQSFLRKDSVWIGFDERSDNQSQGLIHHPHCPFDYCKSESDSVNFTMNSTNLQCSYNRSGHLCGACQRGFSLAVGSSRCLPCSNKFLALLIAFVFAGLALVVFLFICKVTVAAGTISGLIFYANIVRVNQSIFFPSGETNILTVFIAWLNLDLGIETCFYDEMDAYSFTWLQFVFPIYIWLLVGLITILCNVSTTAARILGGTNPIAILATLFFLTFSKLLRTIIAAFSFTTLEYPDGETKVVWLYDGNIGYLDKNDGRHIALFLVSLVVFLFFFLPYTIFLLLGQCILPRLDLNKLKWLSWPNYLRMKSFLDAYHAPYKDRHRYWIGLLLVLRFIMFLISAIVDVASPQDPHVNLLVMSIITSMLGWWAVFVSGGVYKKWYLNVLETSFLLNLVIFAAATQYTKLAGGNQAAVFYISVTFAFSTFIGIVIYHVNHRLRDSRAWRNLVRKQNDRGERDHGWRREDAAADEEMEEMLPQVPPTVSYVDIPTDERREMRPITPPLTPTNVTDVREPLDNHSESEDDSANEEMEEMPPQATPTVTYIDIHIPTGQRRERFPITPPLSLTDFTDVPESLDRLQREVAADEVVQEVLPQVAPTVTAAKAMCPLAPPPLPINFTELREPLDLLNQ